MSRRRLVPSAALVTLALTLGACGPNPESGTWVFTNGEVITNTCNIDEANVSERNFTLLNNDNGTFTIDPEDGSDPFLCTLDGADFICPERLQDSQTNLGVTIDVRVEASGFFESDVFTSGRQEATVSCSGDGCGAAAAIFGVDFPCTSVVNFSASFKN